MDIPAWLKPVGVTVAVLVAALLVAAEFAVVYLGIQAPHGYNQSRLHWNTKNTTRFAGGDVAEVAALVSRAVYPATQPETTRRAPAPRRPGGRS